MDTALQSPQDFLAIIKRRKVSILVPAVGITLIMAVVAFLWPPTYKSTSTILIEEQEIPADYVMSTVTSYVEQRLEVINQRIMSATRLQEIIDRFNLYADKRDKWTREEMIDRMRDDIKLETVRVDVVDRRTGRPSTATIAFTLSYEGKTDPLTVQRVASVLASLYLEENLKVRERQVTEASNFFEDEINRVKQDLDKVEAVIATFKQEHVNELPELLSVNMQSLHDVELKIDRLHDELRGLKEKEEGYQTELAAVSPEMEDQKRLESLKLELNHLRSVYSDKYPDIIRLRAEIKRLEEELRDVDLNIAGSADRPDNPAYISLASRLNSTGTDIDSLERQINSLENDKKKYEQRIARTPVVESEYTSLLVERESMKTKYNDLMKKFMEARVAQGLEQEQKGERFTLIDPAVVPEKPYKPNRKAIILIGMVLGIGSGVGLAALREFMDDSVRNAEALAGATTVPVLAVIPEIVTRLDIESRRKRHRLVYAASVVGCVAFLLLFHFYVMDFDLLWVKVMRKLAL